MRALTFVALAVLGAGCDIQPSPKKESPATTPTPAPAPTEAPRFVQPTPPALPEQPKVETTGDCIEVGKHVAEVFIASATDPAQKSVFEQERTRVVKATAEVCTTQVWSADARGCYMAAKTPAEIKACETQFPGPPPKEQPAAPQKPIVPPGTPQ
jgi:hypothetical protein